MNPELQEGILWSIQKAIGSDLVKDSKGTTILDSKDKKVAGLHNGHVALVPGM